MAFLRVLPPPWLWRTWLWRLTWEVVSCRVWYAKVRAAAQGLVEGLLPDALKPAAVELAPYLLDSLGNEVRIDYGTGHETTFVAFLYCLSRLGVFQAGDEQALVCRVFKSYLQLMRKVQTTYWYCPLSAV